MIIGKYDKERINRMESRINLLEEILCPGEMHDWNSTQEKILGPIDEYHNGTWIKETAVCRRCRKKEITWFR